MSSTRSRLLISVTLIPIAALFALAALDVPLGKPGKFTYLYSPFYLIRALRLPWLVPILLLAWFAVRTPSRRAVPFWLMLVAVVAIAIWNFLAPPRYVSQHAFNFVSPSHDGAFVLEADRIRALSTYLQAFPGYVLSADATEKGTRVASNPPAMTWLAFHIFEAVRVNPDWMRLTPLTERGADALVLQAGFLLAYVLQLGWVLAFVPWYFAARRSVSPNVAAALAFCIVVSPMTMLFAPGKDPAQLLTVGIMVWLWPITVRENDVNWRLFTRALLAGASLVLFAMVGLIHFWIAMLLLLAGLLPILFANLRAAKGPDVSAPRLARGVRRGLLRREAVRIVAGFAGLVLGVLALQAFSGIDWLATVRAVAEAQARVTRGADAMPFVWQLLGIPLFLLFCGPAVWWGLMRGMGIHQDETCTNRTSGTWLVCVTLFLMLATVGFTNVETPRLWIPFAGLVQFGAFLLAFSGNASNPAIAQCDLGNGCARRGASCQLKQLVVAQIIASGLAWSVMDMREAEHRLIGGNDARLFSSIGNSGETVGFAPLDPPYKIYAPHECDSSCEISAGASVSQFAG
ncbi:MAG: hypothetical protein AB7N71_04245 [Phycisphaerae bacterium]